LKSWIGPNIVKNLLIEIEALLCKASISKNTKGISPFTQKSLPKPMRSCKNVKSELLIAATDFTLNPRPSGANDWRQIMPTMTNYTI
jgi:hypothetical protein